MEAAEGIGDPDFPPEEIYTGAEVDKASDLIIGYAPNYRASWDTILGKYPLQVFLDNRDPWSGDHCIDAAFMSGCLFSNRRYPGAEPALEHLAPAICQALCTDRDEDRDNDGDRRGSGQGSG